MQNPVHPSIYYKINIYMKKFLQLLFVNLHTDICLLQIFQNSIFLKRLFFMVLYIGKYGNFILRRLIALFSNEHISQPNQALGLFNKSREILVLSRKLLCSASKYRFFNCCHLRCFCQFEIHNWRQPFSALHVEFPEIGSNSILSYVCIFLHLLL